MTFYLAFFLALYPTIILASFIIFLADIYLNILPDILSGIFQTYIQTFFFAFCLALYSTDILAPFQLTYICTTYLTFYSDILFGILSSSLFDI